jgi:hypothetical protein
MRQICKNYLEGTFSPEKKQEMKDAWKEYEMWETSSREDSILSMERDWQIERIANEARMKNIKIQSIYKFFSEYELNQMDITKFWQAYYFN